MSASDQDPAEPREPAEQPSELEESLNHLGKAMGGVMTRLFGEKVTGVHIDPDRPVIGREVDQAVTSLGDTVGRLLHAVGTGLEAHPTQPSAMVEEVKAAQQAPLEVPEGEAPLTVGLRSLGRGLTRSAEALFGKSPSRGTDASTSESDASQAPEPDPMDDPDDDDR